MEDGHGPEVPVPEPGGQLLRHHDGSVPAAGAADGDRQPGLALLRVGRHQEVEQVLQPLQELARDRQAHDVGADLLGEARQGSQRLDVVGVLHEPDVQHQVGLERDAVLEAEA